MALPCWWSHELLIDEGDVDGLAHPLSPVLNLAEGGDDYHAEAMALSPHVYCPSFPRALRQLGMGGRPLIWDAGRSDDVALNP